MNEHDAPTLPSSEAACPRRPSRLLSAFAGLVVAAVALSVAELCAGLQRAWRSPVLDVGDRVIDAAPIWVKDFAIETFGTNDKPALLVGIASILAVDAMVFGIVALRHRFAVGAAGMAMFGVVGAWAALSRRAAAPWHVVLPSLLGTAAGLGALWLIHRSTSEPRPALEPAPTVDHATSRRLFLGHTSGLIVAFSAGSAGIAAAGRWLGSRFSAAESRAAVVLPRPAEALSTLPADVEVGVTGMTPFITANDRFYRIDTALVAPQQTTDDYRLKVTGMVDRELELSFDDLLARDMIERDITLTCVSNEIGGTLVGTARWLGTRLADLLEEAGVQAGADQVVGRSIDGYACGFPVGVAMDGRDALIAVGMNGEPLPIVHGFPARLIVPGLYGFVSATKWLTEIELTTFDRFDHYWLRRGWAREAPIKLMSRIDTPRGLAKVRAGVVPIAGVAWAQTVGISGVEVQIDDGEWQPAELAAAPSDDTWVQWKLSWDATPGRHSVRVRAIDRNGAIQTADRSEPIPDGASGQHQIVVIVA